MNGQRLPNFTRICLALWLVVSGLVACRVELPSPESEDAPLAVQAGHLPTATAMPPVSPPDPPRAAVRPLAIATRVIISPSEVAPLTAPDPLRFIFPTPGPAPVSAWRPPLYPVPWALTPYDHFYFARPIAADEVNWPLADYRYGGNFFDDIVHTGVDIPAPEGTPVLAAGPGKVVWAGYGLYSGAPNLDDPYGLSVAIRHDFGYKGETLYTVYGHMSQVDVAQGQRVETGHPLGLVGNTGFTTGPHLHFEVRIAGNRFFSTRNPELWIAPPQGWGILAGRVMNTSARLQHRLLVYVRNMSTDQLWTVRSYSAETVNSDPYYQENLVLGDLPAGRYEIRIAFAGVLYTQEIEILAGLVNFFTFEGRKGFHLDPPAPTDPLFTPQFP